MKQKNEACRMQTNECDLPEVCTGENEWCPDDLYKSNGISCHKKDGFCWNGECQIKDRQCQSMWSKSSTSVHASSYDLNKGVHHLPSHLSTEASLNCGWDENGTAILCAEEDKFCGALICHVTKKRPVYEPLSYSIVGPSTYILFSKTLGDGVNSIGKVALGTVCSFQNYTNKYIGVCAKRMNEHYCDFDLKKYYPVSCQTSEGVLCGGSNHGYCNHYRRCLCKADYDPRKNCVEKIRFNSTSSNLQCFTCQDGKYCAIVNRRLTKLSTCPRDDMVCFHIRIKYSNSNVISNIRGCMTKEKCVPGCIEENYTIKCTSCCTSSRCNIKATKQKN